MICLIQTVLMGFIQHHRYRSFLSSVIIRVKNKTESHEKRTCNFNKFARKSRITGLELSAVQFRKSSDK